MKTTGVSSIPKFGFLVFLGHPSEQITYHVTDLISEQVSDFCFGHRKCLFRSEEKQLKWLFLTLKTGTFGARNENLTPLLLT